MAGTIRTPSLGRVEKEWRGGGKGGGRGSKVAPCSYPRGPAGVPPAPPPMGPLLAVPTEPQAQSWGQVGLGAETSIGGPPETKPLWRGPWGRLGMQRAPSPRASIAVSTGHRVRGVSSGMSSEGGSVPHQTQQTSKSLGKAAREAASGWARGKEACSPAWPTSCSPGACAASFEAELPQPPAWSAAPRRAQSPLQPLLLILPGRTPSRTFVSTGGAERLRAGRRALAEALRLQKAP